MNILAISGSLRKNSYNSSLLKALSQFKHENMIINIYDELGLLPFFNADLDNHTLNEDNSPTLVKKFRQQIYNADVLIISTPEYAFEISGVLKNALDWLVSSSVIVNKPVVILSASTSGMGGDKAHQSLTNIMDVISGRVIKKVSLQIGRINKKINSNSEIIDEQLIMQLQNILNKLDMYVT